jgi:DNA-directed RNA polymerase specialized sigma24 family protein
LAASARSRDGKLVRDAQHGSAEALEVLFHRHWTGAYRAAWMVVRDAAAAEDIAQEAFIAAVRALDRFDRRRARCSRSATRALGWSTRTARCNGSGASPRPAGRRADCT